jgi:hypothetical protein
MAQPRVAMDILNKAIEDLKCDGRASDEIKEKLNDFAVRNWLDTWVVPNLEQLREYNCGGIDARELSYRAMI